ncbi:MAG: hypothetical protein FJ224_01505 [Lentisphaerae bacterium]|nr:hypothetical protein [Lentisphaerota bacterium]
MKPLPILAAVILSAGCAGYKVGSVLPQDLQTIHVATFVNKSGEPGIEARCTAATLQELQIDGSLRIVPSEEADAVLTVNLVSYRLEPLRYDTDRPKTTREYRVWVAADISLRRAGTGEVILERKVTGDTTFDTVAGLDLSTAKQASLPAAARDLARKIVESVVECW